MGLEFWNWVRILEWGQREFRNGVRSPGKGSEGDL